VSLFLGALFIVRNKDQAADGLFEHRAYGRRCASFGFGGALGVAGALYHMLNHSLNKSLMFSPAPES